MCSSMGITDSSDELHCIFDQVSNLSITLKASPNQDLCNRVGIEDY